MLRHKERHTISHGCSESCQSWGHWVCRDSSASSTSSWRTLCPLHPLLRTCLWPAYLSECLRLLWTTTVLIHVTCQYYEKPWPSLKYNFHPFRGWTLGQSRNFLVKNCAGSLYDLPASYHDIIYASSRILCIARSASSLCEGYLCSGLIIVCDNACLSRRSPDCWFSAISLAIWTLSFI